MRSKLLPLSLRPAALLVPVFLAVLLLGAASAYAEPVPLNSNLPISHFNLHLVATEEWLNRMVSRTDVTPGIVDDYILGAKVNGEQVTTSHLRIDLRPSSDQIAATFLLNGEIGTTTSGTTEQAVVFTQSRQNFHAAKDFFFDGLILSTRHAQVSVRAQNQNLGASTRFDGTPLQPFITQYILKAAEQRRPAAEEIARNRVADRIYPEFDQRIDRELAGANERLESVVRKRLSDYGVLPTAQRCQSTDRELHYAARIAAERHDFEIVSPSSPLLKSEGGRMYFHSSVIEAAALRNGLAGLKTSDRQLGQILRRFGVSSGDSNGGVPGGVETQIEFDDQRPLSVLFEDDEMEFRLRVKLHPAGQALLPPLTISIPFRLVEQDGERLLRPGQVGVFARSENGRDGAALPGVEALIRQVISSNLRDIPIPANVGEPAWYNGKTPPRLSTIRFREGWLAVGLD